MGAKWKLAVSASVIASLLSEFSMSYAQESPDESRALPTIVVTAQKRDEDIQNVPISVTALSGDMLEAQGIDSIETLSSYVPNFKYDSSSQLINARIGIRGVSSTGNSGFESSVGVFVDETYVPRPGSTLGAMFDLAAVEILRGPQGTLFGRNTSMGALSIRTRKPEFSPDAAVTVGVGSLETYKVEGFVTGPLSDSIAGRFSFSKKEQDAYLENDYENDHELGRQDLGVRGQLLWNATPDISANLAVEYLQIDYHGAGVELYTPSVTQIFADRFFQIHGEQLDYRDSFDQEVYQIHRDQSDNNQLAVNLHVDWDIGDHTLTSITAYRDWEDQQFDEDVVSLPAEILLRDRLTETDNFSQELRLASSGADRLNYILGLFYYDENYTTDTVFHLGSDYCSDVLPALGLSQLVAPCQADPRNAVIDAFGQDLKSYAAFANVTYDLTDEITLTGGLRWSRDQKDGFFERQRPNIAAIPIASNATVGADTDVENTDEKISYVLNASYDFSPDIMGYATASSGFKSGGLNSEAQAVGSQRTFGPESTKNYEIGLKNTLFDGSLIANIALFRMDIDDFQERTFTGTGFLVGNAGSLRQSGVELEIQARPHDKLDLNLALAYLDSEFTDFKGAPGLPGGPPQDLTGQRRQDSPEWSISTGAQWSDVIPNTDLNWFIRGEYQYTSDQFLSAELNPQAEQSAFDIVNFRAGISASDKKWELNGYVRNAFDTGYCVRIFNQVFAGLYGGVNAADNTSVQRCVPGTQLNAGAEFKYRL